MTMVTNSSQVYALVYLSTIDKNISIEQGKEVIAKRSEVNRAIGASGLLINSGCNILRL